MAVVMCISMTAWKLIPKTDFSGKWKINLDKSDKDVGYYAIEVAQTTDYISIERILKNRNGKDSSTTEKIMLDGKISYIKLADSSKAVMKRYTNFKAFNDNGSMTIALRFIDVNKSKSLSELKGFEEWRLGENGNQLIINRTFNYSDKTQVLKWVYDRVK